jgi:phage shock protein E
MMKKINAFMLFCLMAWLGNTAIAGSPVWIDVRSAEENTRDHIANDVHIEYQSIASEIGNYVADKDTPIYLYCAVGGRAAIAKLALTAMGYTQVVNSGGIEDVRIARGIKK